MGSSHRGLFVFLLLFFCSSVWAEKLQISTFNIRWYGKGPTQNGKETRDPYLRDELDTALNDSDVIVFQEIVDVARLKSRVVEGRMNCVTYPHNHKNHQHVVLCHKKKFSFKKEATDDNYTIEGVAYSSGARPALYGVLTRGTKKIAHLMGVHLKAFPDQTQRRLFQAHEISKTIKNFGDDLPVVILGDFNTFPASVTQNKKDDSKLISDVFASYRLALKEVHNPYKYTFLSNRYQNKFDRFWVSKSVKVTQRAVVSEPCRNPASQSYEDIATYNEQVSDHCLVSIELDTNS